MVALGSCSSLSAFALPSSLRSNLEVDVSTCFMLLLVTSDYSSPIIEHSASGFACATLAHYSFHVHCMNLISYGDSGGGRQISMRFTQEIDDFCISLIRN